MWVIFIDVVEKIFGLRIEVHAVICLWHLRKKKIFSEAKHKIICRMKRNCPNRSSVEKWRENKLPRDKIHLQVCGSVTHEKIYNTPRRKQTWRKSHLAQVNWLISSALSCDARDNGFNVLSSSTSLTYETLQPISLSFVVMILHDPRTLSQIHLRRLARFNTFLTSWRYALARIVRIRRMRKSFRLIRVSGKQLEHSIIPGLKLDVNPRRGQREWKKTLTRPVT